MTVINAVSGVGGGWVCFEEEVERFLSTVGGGSITADSG